MQFEITNPFTSATYLRGFILNDIKILMEKVDKLAKNLNSRREVILYYLVRSLLERDMFFNVREETRDKIFFEAVYWASKTETKQKNRPKSFNGVGDKKIERFFTKMTHSIISALIVKHDINQNDIHKSTVKEIKYNLELSTYLNFLFEISCIKRSRNNS